MARMEKLTASAYILRPLVQSSSSLSTSLPRSAELGGLVYHGLFFRTL